MRETTSSDLQVNLPAHLDMVVKERSRLLITRGEGQPAAVLMSLEDYSAVEETLHLLRSPANANRLLSAVADLAAGQGEVRDLAE